MNRCTHQQEIVELCRRISETGLSGASDTPLLRTLHELTGRALSPSGDPADGAVADSFHRLLDSLPSIAVQGYGADGTVFYWNAASERLYGYSAAEAIGKNLVELIIPPHMRDHVRRLIGEWADGGDGPQPAEHELMDKDGHPVPVYSGHAELRHDDGGVEFFCLDMDLRELKTAQDALLRSERMAAVGTLAAGVAHEFNNIHTIVLCGLEMLLGRDDLTDGVRSGLEPIREASLRAATVTKNLMAFAQTETVERRVVALNDVIQDVLRIVWREFESEGIQTSIQLKGMAQVVGDPNQLGQAVLHLVINARHAMLERPVRKLTISTGEMGDEVFIRVSDTGCGIPQEHLRRIFMPFFSTKGEHASGLTPQSRIKGTGLGLAVTDRIVKDHGGRIEVDSRVDQGASVTVRLPSARSVEHVSEPEEVDESDPPHILIVEDEIALLDMLNMLLSAEGWDVTATDDGHDALAAMRERRIDVALLDLQMPKMSGEEILDAIGELPDEVRPEAVVITGKRTASPNYPGAFACLIKPFQIPELLDRIRAAVHVRRARDAEPESDSSSHR